jgi:hypothetical protein
VGTNPAPSNQERHRAVSDNTEALALVGHLEIALLAYAYIFEDIANGSPLNPDQAKSLKESTDSLLLEVRQARCSLQELEIDE